MMSKINRYPKSQQEHHEFITAELQKGIRSGNATAWDKDEFLKKARKRAGLKTED